MFQLRPYQAEAVARGAQFLKCGKGNGIMVLPTGSGKSLIIANLALQLDKPILVFQPSKEILEQNFLKFSSYGLVDCSIFSASMGKKEISKVTFATIGSVYNVRQHFVGMFSYILIDECHLVKPSDGMYSEVLRLLGLRCLGLTATPYRLYSTKQGSQIRFITRTRERVFQTMVFQVPIQTLCAQGYLASLQYFSLMRIELQNLSLNSTGNDYTDESLKAEYKRSNFYASVEEIVGRLLKAGRTRILVFTRFTEEAAYISRKFGNLAGFVSGETPKRERERLLEDFKSKRLHVMCNVGVLTTGFDYPALDTIVMARPTRSLTLWYQIVGRALRPFKDKVGWVVDLCGTYTRFGRVEDLAIRDENGRGGYEVYSGNRRISYNYF